MGNKSANRSNILPTCYGNMGHGPSDTNYQNHLCSNRYDLTPHHHNGHVNQNQTNTIYCIVSNHCYDDQKEYHDIIFQCKNGVYDIVRTQIRGNLSIPYQHPMKEKVDSLVPSEHQGGCKILGTKSPHIFLGDVENKQISETPGNQPDDLVKIPFDCVMKTIVEFTDMDTCCFVKNNDIMICVSKHAIKAVHKNRKKLEKTHRDYVSVRYNYTVEHK